ncbi:hypothetical protein [Streptomyces sp. NPDC002671]
MVDKDGTAHVDVRKVEIPHRGSSWYQRINAHVAHLQGMLNKFVGLREANGGISYADKEIVLQIQSHLTAAQGVLEDHRLLRRMSGASADRALANAHEAEVALLRIAPDAELYNKGLYTLSHARLHLEKDDTLLQQMEAVMHELGAHGAEPAHPGPFRELAAITLHAAYQSEEAQRARVRSFTQIVLVAAAALWILAVGLGLWASLSPDVAARFCSPARTGHGLVCSLGSTPQSGSVYFLEFLGVCGAAVGGAASLRNVRGTSGPYHVASGLTFLRLPIGALIAATGIMLVSAQFIPGLTSLDTSTRIGAWAFAFGILQESVTRAVDRRGRSLLDAVKGPGSPTADPDSPAARKGPSPPRPT